MKKVLITGAAGFIGSHFARRLQEESRFELFGYDNFHTGKIRNLEGVRIRMGQPIEHPRMDYILHLGMASSSPMYLENPYFIL